jgi:hypothetical protein
MDKLNTVKLAQVDWAIKSTIKYIKQWSERELENLFSNNSLINNSPIIFQLGHNGYLVGNCSLMKTADNRWQLNYRYSDLEKTFDDKKAAFLFAIYYQTGKMRLADKIYESDLSVSRLSDKVQFFRQRAYLARKVKNYDKSDFYQIRLNEYNMRLSQARTLLEKNLKTTKYI